MLNSIVIKGARTHNLKNLDISIPRDNIVVFTGPSGSGKSSLAFDTLYAEGQRRYIESLSAYARQFIEQLQKPDVDSIEGLSPSIAIEQKTAAKNLRSTVGTVTEIYDYLRVAYTRIGKLTCYKCSNPISSQNVQQITDSVSAMPEGTRIQVLAPVVMGRKGEYRKELSEARRKGFIRARIDGETVDITRDVPLNKHKRHTIEIVVDRLIIKPGIEKHVSEAVAQATDIADVIVINVTDEEQDLFFSTKLACPRCGTSYSEISPRLFSFNSPFGACPTCNGLGYGHEDEDDEEVRDLAVCPSCGGYRLKKEALSVKMNGLHIGELSALSVKELASFLDNLRLTRSEEFIISKVLKETKERLRFLNEVGLDYLTLTRPALTLSSGEEQRLKLATQIGSALSGVLYIFDEPSIGLHPRDCQRFLDSLRKLRKLGNTVIVVEHDEDTIRKADYVIDMGPGAGNSGGYVVSEGKLKSVIKDKRSLTGAYLRREREIPVPTGRREPKEYITVKEAKGFNLKNINVRIPLGVFTCVTGVSGSGKSTFIIEILYKALAQRLHSATAVPGLHKEITGVEKVDRVIDVDQSPLGRTPRSNPATYTGIFTLIRDLFSRVPESRVRGYKSGRFSFNIPGGRCESCKGDGFIKVSMHFLPDVYIPCDECKGARYNSETLNIRYKDMSISDILDMTVSQALDFFSPVPPLRQRLSTLDKVGLGYIKLGQPATTLSGGEAQRVKLSRELGKKTTTSTLYILDEPTTGLHFVDIQRLLQILNGLVDTGNTVVVIEHNLEIIKCADYVIDLGPESGDGGGEVVVAGTPEEVTSHPISHTGKFLRKKLPNQLRVA